MTTHHSRAYSCIHQIFGLVTAIYMLLPQGTSAAQVIQTLPFYDSFDYNPGSAGLASASSTVWEACPSTSNLQVTTNSLTLAGYVPSAGNSGVGVTHGVRFAGTQFTRQTAADGTTVYVSFLYQLTAYAAKDTNGVIAFLDATNITSNAMPGTAALALLIDHTGRIGINAGSPSTNGAQYETSATALNTTVLIVVRYTFHTSPTKDVIDLWVNPSSASYGGSAPIPDITITSAANWPSLAYFSLSYNNNDTTFGEKWDEVRISTTWAQAVPSSNTPGSATAAHSLMVSASPTSIVASGSSTSTVKMQARDLTGVNLTSGGASVTFATTLGSVGSTTDNGDGTYQATLTSSTILGNATVTAKLGGTSIATIGTATNSASLAVNFGLGPVSASASTATANPTNPASDGVTTSTLTVTATDDYGHPLTNQTVSLSVSGSGNTVSTPANTGANGQTTATIASTVPETKTITVTIGGTQISAQPTVTFIAGGVSPSKSIAVASPSTGLTADGVTTSTITVTANDGSSNPLSGKTVVLGVSGSGNILSQLSPTTDVNGQITATLASTVAQTKTITVTIDGTVINAQPTVTFVSGAATQIVFTSQPVTTPVNMTLSSVVVQIEDALGNAVPQSGATVTLALSAGTLSGTNPQMTDGTGKATFNDLSVPVISYGLTLTASANGFSPVQSTVFDAPPKTFYKASGTAALNLASSWATTSGGAGPAGPPASDGLAVWDANSGSGNIDIGASASWYGMVYRGNGSVTITDTAGGHTLRLDAGSLDGSDTIHSQTINNNMALAADQTWNWSSNSYALTVTGNIDNGGYQLTINGNNGNAGEKFNGAVIGNGGLTLTGSAAVTLSGTNTYAGNTTVNGGKLVINTNGSIANSAGIVLASGVTFDVSVASPFTVFGSQTLSDGTNGTGTATIIASTASGGPSSLILANGAQTAFTVVGNTSSGSVTAGIIKVLGGVTLNGNPITINVTGAPLPAGTYTLLTATNGFTVNSALPNPTIIGQGLAGNSLPQIVVSGQNLQLAVGFGISPAVVNNNCGDSATFTATPAYGAISYQWYDSSFQPITDSTNTTLVLTSTHPADSGTYFIVATGLAWALTNSVTLITTDTAPPAMALNGDGTVLIPLNATYTELSATAYDKCAGDSLSVSTSGTVNTTTTGEYDITYSTTSGNGVQGSIVRAVIVFDPTVTQPPISMNLDFGAATDSNPGNLITVPAGWSLLAYGDLYQQPNIWGSPSFPNPDGNNPGLTLSFGNISGWSTASTETGANNSVVVGISTNGFFNYGSEPAGNGLPATFTLTGVPVGECVSIYAVNSWSGMANAPVITYGGQTTTVTAASFGGSPALGEFQCLGTAIATNGTVTGSWTGIGGTTTEGQIGGMIIQVQSVPLNNLAIAPSSIAVQCGSNVTFTASVYGLPPIAYQWFDNNTNAILGATNASYTLTDPTDASAGNYMVVAQNAYNSLTNVATITSILHSAQPVMALNGGSPVYALVNQPYVDAGATAYDLCAQSGLTVSSSGTVDTSTPGTYYVTYSATTDDGTPGTIARTVIVSTTPNFGPNVLVFDPSTPDIQSQIDSVFAQMKYNQFGTQRYTLLFKPGVYPNLDINVGYYTELLGLGLMPDNTVINGFMHSDGVLVNENATQNFWRSAANFAVISTNSANYTMWAVSQGTSLRRMHIEGNLDLADFYGGSYSSGGFMSDSKVDGTMSSLSQQQWLNRNDNLGLWAGGVWNMVFVGVSNPPVGTWPTKVYTVITNTPLVAEKPFLYLDTNGDYAVMVPALQTNSFGITWATGPTPGVSIPITQFYIAHAGTDNAASINAALNAGLNLILTPGVYQLTGSLNVTRPDTIILGLGYATLVPQTGTSAMVISDVDGVKVSGLIVDAGPVQSTNLLQVGAGVSSLDHSGDPTFLYDISMRVGGATGGSTLSCMQIDANDVVGDNLWLWRADHGAGVGWTQNACNNGLIVNGDRVTMYGLFVEHFEQYQTLWNGNWGRLYFYQSEFPYDPPSQDAWSEAPGVDGYASYKVADQVTSHQAYGLGIYAVFIDSTNISCFNAIETPTNSQQVNMHDMITIYIEGDTTGDGVSALYHIINGTGTSIYGPGFAGPATAGYLWQYPTFGICASLSGVNTSISFPTESCHSYQLQYKNNLTDPSWSNLGSPVGGNDALKTITDPTSETNRFYKMLYY
jgi:hypothetical protein